ncbi:GNAT family N-acetyltransferase [Bacillus pfraonensis]|uniref:GNAT family N-acetyltransferase n=1 Tax=Bacillus TaxID=1386 RepID=UPI002A54399F|nr:GNAT family N-acetyltransferase [Bacillus pseudomycoides]
MKFVQNLEKDVWDMEPIPLHQTITASQNGGLLLGAFLNGEMIGFSYSFPGFFEGQSYLCSHMLGIHPSHQGKGVGAGLKQAQKKLAYEKGYNLITWTYDPLETRNAYLNLSKLRAICSTYMENCYGEMEDNLNRGLPSDRFKVEWWIDSSHVSKQQEDYMNQAQHVIQWVQSKDHLPKLINLEKDLHNIAAMDTPLLVPVPSNFQQMKNTDYDLAIDWRFKTREIFQTLFSQQYVAVSLIKNAGELVHYYVLVKQQNLEGNGIIRKIQ